ncbi:hypothetical protein MD484_g4442, partial [Candolleomyces efflorescens]
MESAPTRRLSVPRQADDLERGLLPSPKPQSASPPMSPYLGHQDGSTVSSPTYSPTASDPPSPYSTGPNTPVLTSSVLSPYILHGSRISLSESAKAMLSSQSWASVSFSGSEVSPYGLGIHSLATDPGSLRYRSKANAEHLEGSDSLIFAAPDDDFDIQPALTALDSFGVSPSSGDHFPNSRTLPPSTPTFPSRSAIPEGIATKGVTPQTDSHLSPVLCQQYPIIPVRSPLHRSALHRSMMLMAPPHLPGAHPIDVLPLSPSVASPAPPTHRDAQNDQENDAKPSPQSTDDSMLAFSTSTFLSVPDLTLVLNDDIENAKLPSSFSAPELRYLVFYYEHYCQEPPSFGKTAVRGVEEGSQDANISDSHGSVGVSQKEEAEDAIIAPTDPEEAVHRAAPSTVLPSGTPTPPIASEPMAGLSDAEYEVETDRESTSTSQYMSLSSSEDESSSGSEHDAAIVQARRGSIAQPVFFMRVPGTRESVRLSLFPPDAVFRGSTIFVAPGRSRSGTNDTQFTASTISTEDTTSASYLSAGESFSEIVSDEESASTCLSLEVENGSEGVKSDGDGDEFMGGNSDNDEVEANWATWGRSKAVEYRDQGSDPDPSSSGSGVMTLFNSNHRHPTTIAPTSITSQSRPQSNLREVMGSRITGPLSTDSTGERKHNPRRQSLSILRTSILVQTDNSIALGDLVGLTFADTRYPLFVAGMPSQTSVHTHLSRAMTITSLAPSSLSRGGTTKSTTTTKEGSSRKRERNRGRGQENAGTSPRRAHYRKRDHTMIEQQQQQKQTVGMSRRNGGVDLRDLGFVRPESVFYVC